MVVGLGEWLRNKHKTRMITMMNKELVVGIRVAKIWACTCNSVSAGGVTHYR